jgi:micrococcal nuclease
MRHGLKLAAALLANLAATLPAVAAEPPDCFYSYKADIVRIVDGDTVVANIDLGCEVWRHNEHLRLFGIDTPDRGDVGYTEATDALAQLIEGQRVLICTVKAKRSDVEAKGSFGRYLATIWIDDLNVNQWLLENGFADVYK